MQWKEATELQLLDSFESCVNRSKHLVLVCRMQIGTVPV
jgi:hypothetical protein